MLKTRTFIALCCLLLVAMGPWGCTPEAKTEIIPGHAEASSTTSRTRLSIKQSHPPAPPAPVAVEPPDTSQRIRLRLISKEPPCSSPLASGSSPPSPSVPSPSCLPAAPALPAGKTD